VLLLVFLMTLVTFAIGFLQTLLGPMLLSYTSVGTLGTITSLSATGMLVSSLFISLFSKTTRQAFVMSVSLGVAGLSFSLMGLTTSVYFIVVSGFLFFCALPFVNTSADVLIRKNIDNDKQGRVWGIIGVVSQLGYVLAYVISGPLADHVFNPLLRQGGIQASSVGRLVGVGPGRGIGLMLVLSGALVVLLAFLTAGIRPIRELEDI
jgi:MFS family permease